MCTCRVKLGEVIYLLFRSAFCLLSTSRFFFDRQDGSLQSLGALAPTIRGAVRGGDPP
jgi:hypothetical protein